MSTPKPLLEIFINGDCATGKTTVAHLIARELRKLGIQATLRDHPDQPIYPDDDLPVDNFLFEKLKALKDKEVQVQIVTHQERRTKP